jgi:hypothetical protein
MRLTPKRGGFGIAIPVRGGERAAWARGDGIVKGRVVFAEMAIVGTGNGGM